MEFVVEVFFCRLKQQLKLFYATFGFRLFHLDWRFRSCDLWPSASDGLSVLQLMQRLQEAQEAPVSRFTCFLYSFQWEDFNCGAAVLKNCSSAPKIRFPPKVKNVFPPFSWVSFFLHLHHWACFCLPDETDTQKHPPPLPPPASAAPEYWQKRFCWKRQLCVHHLVNVIRVQLLFLSEKPEEESCPLRPNRRRSPSWVTFVTPQSFTTKSGNNNESEVFLPGSRHAD